MKALGKHLGTTMLWLVATAHEFQSIGKLPVRYRGFSDGNFACSYDDVEIAPELTGHGLPLSKCEAYNRVYDQFYRSR
jgi:hypothetical protein